MKDLKHIHYYESLLESAHNDLTDDLREAADVDKDQNEGGYDVDDSHYGNRFEEAYRQ